MRHRSLGAAVMATAMLGLACQSSAQTPAPPATPPAAPAAPAAPPPSPHKQELLNKLADVANVRANATLGFQALMGNLSASFNGVAQQVVGASQLVAPADRQATIDRIVAARDRVVKQIGDRIAQRVDYPKMSVDTYMRLYDKLFTEQELGDLLTFYQTPTGRKLTSSAQQMLAESGQAQGQLLTVTRQVVDEVMKEEIAKKP